MDEEGSHPYLAGLSLLWTSQGVSSPEGHPLRGARHHGGRVVPRRARTPGCLLDAGDLINGDIVVGFNRKRLEELLKGDR